MLNTSEWKTSTTNTLTYPSKYNIKISSVHKIPLIKKVPFPFILFGEIKFFTQTCIKSLYNKAILTTFVVVTPVYQIKTSNWDLLALGKVSFYFILNNPFLCANLHEQIFSLPDKFIDAKGKYVHAQPNTFFFTYYLNNMYVLVIVNINKLFSVDFHCIILVTG